MSLLDKIKEWLASKNGGKPKKAPIPKTVRWKIV